MHTAPSLHSIKAKHELFTYSSFRSLKISMNIKVCWSSPEVCFCARWPQVSKWTKLIQRANQLLFAVVSRILVLARRPCE